MLLIRKYTDRNYQKNTYSAALLKNDEFVEKFNNLSDDALTLLLQRYRVKTEIFNVKNKSDLHFMNK